jgi:hypothetical protein
VYVSKLLIVAAMVAVSALILVIGVLLEGALLHQFDPEHRFGFPAPAGMILRQAGQMVGLAFLSLAVQHWVSLRWRSFSIAIGFGSVAMVTSFAMLMTAGQYGGWPQYFPWALPMLVVARQPQNIPLALWASGLAGIGASVAGCIDFCRREVT